uniref:cyclin-D4-1-like isoform X2 n=1 Tax=Erigeron canadensis TaxID=72917 RepID=UPI001CB8F897|nr:cyclin-D4-1-like isoform X2 [Erigeron canadensis]
MSDNSITSNAPFSTVVNHHSLTIIDSLIATELRHSPPHDYLTRCHHHLTHRQDSINWILNAHSQHVFQPITALLSVNYFDRFLSASPASLEWKNGWGYQLLSVACLSIAAKLEEVQVPFLSDLQVSEPRFVFESKTIQRMELCVLSELNWTLRSITPFDFLHYFISILPTSFCPNHIHFQSKCSDIIIKTTRAAAAVISAAGEGVEVPESYYETVKKESVRSCHQLMDEYLVDTCPSADVSKKSWRTDNEPPASPDGVLDAATCGSCDSGDRVLAPATISGEEAVRVTKIRG